jgi:glutamate N-acetyltransferase/amino-acid N-acetyltransferase
VSVTAARGFRAAGATAGLKPSGESDIAIVVNDGPDALVAAVFTANRCKANPVLWSERVVADGVARAVALNSGGANCYTGPAGFQTTHATAELVGELTGIDPGDVVVCSTGLIGEQLDEKLLCDGLREAAGVLATGADAGDAAARAIMTTDTRPKQARATRAGWCVGGMAKGAGMLAPALATMLVVLTTDAVVTPTDLDAALRDATRRTFDRLDTDGCMSTNDTVVLLSSGASGVRVEREALTDAVYEVCHALAMDLLGDAEGAEHQIAITVRGAVSETEAVEVGRSVARSSLFKCAIYGNDPNWGRVLAAVGTTGARFDPTVLDVDFNGVRVCRAGGVGEPRGLVDLTPAQVRVDIDLHAGDATATVWTTDLTPGYVHENSAYST